MQSINLLAIQEITLNIMEQLQKHIQKNKERYDSLNTQVQAMQNDVNAIKNSLAKISEISNDENVKTILSELETINENVHVLRNNFPY